MGDSDDYLEQGFDPRSVTVPRLRSILVTHNIDYPSTAKKPQLVQLVTDHVLPHAAKLRAQRAKAKRSSMGIVNAGSTQDVKAWSDHDLLPPPPSARRSQSPRKSSARGVALDAEPEPLAAPRSVKRTARSASRQLPREADEAPQAPKSTRRSLRSATPRIKVESEEDQSSTDQTQDSSDEESVFTNDNPFQSGTPPVPRMLTNRPQPASAQTVRRVSPLARHQEPPVNRATASRSLEGSLPRHTSPTWGHELEPGEEFTPDQQLELERAARQGELPIPRNVSPGQTRQRNVKSPLIVLLLALLSSYAAWYRQEKISVGYCGIGKPAKSLFSPEISVPNFALSWVQPQCETCPPHAYCFEDFSVSCESDFLLKPHPLSLGGLIPLPPSCEPDGEKARRVQAVANKAVEELRQRRADFECGARADGNGDQPISAAVSEEELKETVSKKRNKRLNSQEFDDLWASAIGDVKSRDEVVIQVDTTESVMQATERPIPPAFQQDSHQPLSLVFRSLAPSSVPSGSDWQDIDSQLDF
ncbi:hypothetical protein CDD81_2941 [Ophiocordyceps australis]|uniref:LEM-like domain-containing protein n=1 Tax=Ophiocordyceps australis TaxID=1399860 RepID=A0A2C5YIP4_9HYPO|nr:hypothetical protein CDD81_2941 [Ophiocordyceps australis]